jgi:flavin reductase (DIM6/NTAB) family NADH-FMN oxidoreductase RutF
MPAAEVGAPLIKECYANFECRLADGSMISKHGLFIWELAKTHVATSPRYPETFHCRGDGIFMLSGRSIKLQEIQTREPVIPGATMPSSCLKHLRCPRPPGSDV